jgi:RNA polymerase sigma factor (sigma-70 family)
MGACLFAFSDAYRRWERAARRHQEILPLLAEQDMAKAVHAEPEPLSDDVSDALRELSAPAWHVVVLRMEGYSTREIASALGKSQRAVEGIWYRTRRALRVRLSGV